MTLAERFGWTLLASCAIGVLLILFGEVMPDAWGITLEELAQGEKREKAETGTFVAWLNEFLGYVTSSFLLEGAWLAVKITVLAMLIGLFLGLVLALMRLSGIWPVSAVAWFYIWFMRGTPQLLQLVFIFDALPLIGLRFDTFTTAVIGFALNEAAFSGEIIRGGIISVDRNQNHRRQVARHGPHSHAAPHHHAAGAPPHPAGHHERHDQHVEAHVDRVRDLRQRADLPCPADRRAELQVLHRVRRRRRDLPGDDQRHLHRPGDSRAAL